jgi:hypothetical protein
MVSPQLCGRGGAQNAKATAALGLLERSDMDQRGVFSMNRLWDISMVYI